MKYRYLGESGLLVSRVCLGAMTFGMDDWGCDRDTSFAIINRFIEAGGNFIDTADMYSFGGSEEILGQALSEHSRDDLVLASKCYFRMKDTPNAKGLSRKHITESCQASLQRLGTDYLDLYQIHGPDPYTPIEETMRTLDDLVRQGLVRYIGCSNLFAWQLVKANGIAAKLNLETFCSGQYMYNLIRRDVEREILPACADQGVGLLCWSPLAGGFLTGKYTKATEPEQGTRIAIRGFEQPRYWHDAGFKIVDEVKAIANQQDKSPAQVATAWLLHDQRVTAVIIGTTKLAQLEDNLVAGDWDLSDADCRRLADVAAFNPGYPQEWIELTYPDTFDGAEFGP